MEPACRGAYNKKFTQETIGVFTNLGKGGTGWKMADEEQLLESDKKQGGSFNLCHNHLPHVKVCIRSNGDQLNTYAMAIFFVFLRIFWPVLLTLALQAERERERKRESESKTAEQTEDYKNERARADPTYMLHVRACNTTDTKGVQK